MELEGIITPLGLYLLSVNFLAFLLYGADKYKAIHNEWRIPERILLLLAVIGGAFGALFAMQFFRHKTKKMKFKLGIPLLCFLWGYLLLFPTS